MDKIILAVSIILRFALSLGQDCYFDFEDPSELLNFGNGCDGAKPVWEIVDRPEGYPAEGYGDKVLTIKEGVQGCIETTKKVVVIDNPRFTVDFLWNGPAGAYSDVTLALQCAGNVIAWKLLSGFRPTAAKWFHAENTYTVTAGECTVKLTVYRNSQQLAIDRINIIGADSSTCYAVTKPVPTTTSTTHPTTTTTEPSTSSTTHPTTTTTEPSTTSTTQPTTTSTEPPTIITTISTEPSTTSTTQPTTISTEPPTINTTISTEPPTTSTTQPTTTTSELPTTTSTTSIGPPKLNITTTLPTSTSTVSSVNPTNSPTPTHDPSLTATGVPSVSNSQPTSTKAPNQQGGGIGDLYMVTIIATAGGIAAFCFLTCTIIIWVKPRIKKLRRKPLNNGSFMPSKINVL